MDIGMLWFDNDPKKGLNEKVRSAAYYYREKYGNEPNVCFVHPSMLSSKRTKTDAITIKTDQAVLPHHFWIGNNGSRI